MAENAPSELGVFPARGGDAWLWIPVSFDGEAVNEAAYTGRFFVGCVGKGSRPRRGGDACVAPVAHAQSPIEETLPPRATQASPSHSHPAPAPTRTTCVKWPGKDLCNNLPLKTSEEDRADEREQEEASH
jgi:hypothetical protein